MSDHTITWIHRDGDSIVGQVTCTAPPTASCRYQCPMGCETWELEAHKHGYEVVDCLAVGWWANAISVAECGPICTENEPVRNGAVTLDWDGDTWLWEYADQLVPGTKLTSNDSEPTVGTVVVTQDDGVWLRFDGEGRSWTRLGDSDDTESWTRVAGNYGPVTVLTTGADL